MRKLIFLVLVLLIQSCLFMVSAQSCRMVQRDLCNISMEEKQKMINDEVQNSDLIVAYYVVSIDTFYFDEKNFYFLIYKCKVLQQLNSNKVKYDFDYFNILISMENIGNIFPFDRKQHVPGKENIAFLKQSEVKVPNEFGINNFEWLSSSYGIKRFFIEKQNTGFYFKSENGICVENLETLNLLLVKAGVNAVNYPTDFYIDHNVDYEELYKQNNKK